MLRFHGSRDKVTYEQVGYNSRLDELQARCCACCCPSSTAGPTHRRAGGELVRRGGPRRARRAAAPGDRRAARRGTSTSCATRDADALARGAGRARASARAAYYRTPVHRQPAMARVRRRPVELPGTDEAARTHLALPDERGARRAEQVDRGRRRAIRDARLGRPDQQPARARAAAGDRGAARARRTRCRSPRATSRRRSSCASASGSTHEAIGRHRGGRLGRQGARARSPLAARWRAGRGGAALRPRARPRLQRRHGRRRAAAHPVLDDVRLRVGDGAAHGQLPPGRRRRRARGDPARAPRPLRRARQAARATRGSRRSTTSPTSSPTAAVLDELGLDAGAADRRRAHAARRSRSTTASRTRCSPTCCDRLRRAGVQAVVLPRTRRAARRAGARGRLHRPRARDRRAVADRLRRPRRLAPAGR